MDARAALLSGLAIPAHPLALDARGRFDERCQRALSRYYLEAGAGGLAVGVHTTQFEIREHGLLEPVLRTAAEVAGEGAGAPLLIAGVCGGTEQAVGEARLAARLGYHAGLLSLAALRAATLDALIEHCRRVAAEIPLFGFYLQPAVGGRDLPLGFWRRFLEIPEVVAIKVAPFDRYRTLDVVRAVAESGRAGEVALYTGNDDHILLDLLATYEVATATGLVRVRFAGGLLGHWAVWMRRAVEQMERCRRERGALGRSRETLAADGAPSAETLAADAAVSAETLAADAAVSAETLAADAAVSAETRAAHWSSKSRTPAASGAVSAETLTLAAQVTEANAALFDPAHRFAGCIPGIHHVLHAQGLLASARLLDPSATLSPGQAEAIERVRSAYPHLTDDAFVRENLARWLD